MNTVRIFTDDIKIKFTTGFMKRGRKVEDDGIQMPGETAIDDIGDGGYKYLRVLKLDKIKMEELKLKIRQDSESERFQNQS